MYKCQLKSRNPVYPKLYVTSWALIYMLCRILPLQIWKGAIISDKQYNLTKSLVRFSSISVVIVKLAFPVCVVFPSRGRKGRNKQVGDSFKCCAITKDVYCIHCASGECHK